MSSTCVVCHLPLPTKILKQNQVRKDGNSLRDRDRDSNFRDREFRERDPERDWGRLRRPAGPPPGSLGGGGAGMRDRDRGGGGGGDGGGGGEPRRPPGGGGLAALARESSAPW